MIASRLAWAPGGAWTGKAARAATCVALAALGPVRVACAQGAEGAPGGPATGADMGSGTGTGAPAPAGGVSSTSFRPGHNLTLLAVAQQSRWRVGKAGEVRGLEFESWEPGVVLRYSFHINLVRKFGLVLGTGMGAWYQNRTYDGFRPGSNVQFPSIVAGFVQNFQADTRVIFNAEYSAHWYPWLRTRGATDRSDPKNPRETRVDLAPIPDGFTAYAQIDNFSRRAAALSAVAGWRVVSNTLLGRPSSNTLLSTLSFSTRGAFVALGITWTLGDELGR